MKKLAACLLLITFLCFSFGCTNMNKTEQGVLSGGVIGAAAGAGISALTGGNAGLGALIGGGLGVVAGGIVGHNQE